MGGQGDYYRAPLTSSGRALNILNTPLTWSSGEGISNVRGYNKFKPIQTAPKQVKDRFIFDTLMAVF